MRPDSRHLLREEQDIAVVVHGRYLEGPEPRDHIVIRVLVIVIGDKLAVNVLHCPLLRHLVKKARSIRYQLGDSCLHASKVLLILGFVDLGVPLTLLLGHSGNFKNNNGSLGHLKLYN